MHLPTGASTSELLCTPFLDTDTKEDTKAADLVLASRGYPRWLIRFLRNICGIGLSTQIIVWEEWHLDIGDVILGYGPLFVVLGLFLCWLSLIFSSLQVAAVGIGLIALGILCVLFFIWHCNRERKKFEEWKIQHREINEP